MFLDVLESLMEKHGLNKSTLSKQSGIPYTTIDGFFKKGFENTKLSTLRQLANFFHVTLDYLVTGDTETTPKILSIYNQLNDLGKQKAIENISILAKVPEYQLFPNKGKEADDSHLTAAERQRKALEDYKESLKYEKAAFGSGVQSFTPPDLTSDQIRELIKEAKKNQ